VLAAFEVPPGERKEFQEFVDGLGYPYTLEPDNAAFRLFLS
jgi:threonine dehydratase